MESFHLNLFAGQDQFRQTEGNMDTGCTEQWKDLQVETMGNVSDI